MLLVVIEGGVVACGLPFFLTVVVGASAAFLVRGLMVGTGVETVFGKVVCGSAAFLVRWQLGPA